MPPILHPPRGIFLNTARAQCSIYESGRMMFDALKLSDRYTLDYVEVSHENHAIHVDYDFFVFNFHYFTMSWLDTRTVRQLPGRKIAFVLEALPNNPFACVSSEDFDAYCVLDPTMNLPNPRVYAFPRPLEIPPALPPYEEPPVPVIGTFGFSTPGKGFDLVVAAVNKEFDRAIIRLNIPIGSYTGSAGAADALAQQCRIAAKPGIEIIETHDYMTKPQLIAWCARNTINCFLYNRNIPGLSATTDQAISSGRPLLVSANETFRHIHPYIAPYPQQSLKQAIVESIPQVLRMQHDWSPQNFAIRFAGVLDDLGVIGGVASTDSQIPQ